MLTKNKVNRNIQDRLNKLDKSGINKLLQYYLDSSAILIFDKRYEIVDILDTTYAGEITKLDEKQNKLLFQQRDLRIGDKLFLFEVKNTFNGKIENWHLIDLMIEGDVAMRYMETYILSKITDRDFTFTETLAGKKGSSKSYKVPISEEDRNNLYDSEQIQNLRFFEVYKEDVPKKEKGKKKKKEKEKEKFPDGLYDVEFPYPDNDQLYEYDRQEFCVVGDVVRIDEDYAKNNGITSIVEIANFVPDERKAFVIDTSPDELPIFIPIEHIIELYKEDEQEQEAEKPPVISEAITFLEKLKLEYQDRTFITSIFFPNDKIREPYTKLQAVSQFIDEKYYIPGYDSMVELDKKVLKYFILVIKNNNKYFGQSGKFYYWFDKFNPLLKRISSNNNVVYLNLFADIYIYMTGENSFSTYTYYPADKNGFRADFVLKEGMLRQKDDDYFGSYDFQQIFNALNETPEKVTFFDSLDLNNFIIPRMSRFVDLLKNAN